MPSRLRRRIFTAVICFSALFSGGGVPAPAQSDTGEISITVTSEKDKQPIADARVLLIGPVTTSALTTKAGVIHYTDAPSGIYRLRVFRPGYLPGISKDFEVLGGRSVAVAVELAGEGLRTIAVVTSTSRVSVSSSSIDANGAVRRISNSLEDALDKLAGVSVTQSSSDPDAAVTVSLHNQDEAQTAITLDGLPLGGPGSAVDLGAFDTDLFTGAATSFGPQAGALGGAVNFRTLQPTQTPQASFSGTLGGFDQWNYAASTTGSAGKLGYALVHTERGGNRPLTFQTFLDQSGLSYEHGGESRQTGDYLKLRYSLDDRTSMYATGLVSNRAIAALCTSFVTVVPCGSGPGNSTSLHSGFAYLTIDSLVGSVAVSASGFTLSTASSRDFASQIIAGVPAPEVTENTGDSRGLSYSATVSQAKHTVVLSGTVTNTSTQFAPTLGSSFVTSSSNAVSSSTEQLSDAIASSDYVSVTPRVSLASSTGIGTSVLGGMSVSWQPQRNDAIVGSVSLGSSQPGNNRAKSFSDPATAQFNCASRYAIVQGPGDANGPQSAFDASIAWSHRFRRGTFSADVYTQSQAGQIIGALVNGAGEPAGYFPAGYLAAVDAAYASPYVCAGAAALGLQNVYVNEPIGGTRRLYEGFDVSGELALGRNVTVLPSYSSNVAELVGADARLASASSTSIVGAQLPGRPLHRGGLTVDALLSERSGAEVIANAQYTGANNFQHLGSYLTANAGFSRPVAGGRLTVLETNVFGTGTGLFASDALAVAQPLSGGGSVVLPAFPLAPRTLSLTYTRAIGGPAPAPAFQSPAAAAPAKGERLRVAPEPPPAGVDPLSLATGRASCDADAQKLAGPLLGELRSYVRAYEAKTALPGVDGFTLAPQTTKTGYAVQITPQFPRPTGGPAAGLPGGPPPLGAGRPGGADGAPGPGRGRGRSFGAGPRPSFARNPAFERFRAVFSCAYVTPLSRDDAVARGIVLPPGGRPALFYVSGIGIAVVRPAELPAGGGSLKASK